MSKAKARVCLLLASAVYGTYPVLLRALQATGSEPLPSVFVAFVRYQFLTIFAASLRGVRILQSRLAATPNPSTGMVPHAAVSVADAPHGNHLWLAAAELALITVVTSLLSIFGVSRVPAVTSEILTSTLHIFVPLQTLLLLGHADFGARTWSGCAIAFVAAVVTTLVESGPGQAHGAGSHDYLAQAALIASSFFFGIGRVRTHAHLRTHRAESLNTARMVCMGAMSVVPLLFDLASGGSSRTTLTRLHKVLPVQWALMGLSVFLSAFVASSLQFMALDTIPAANAQPFAALQPLFAALWSILFLSEPISAGAAVGGLLMVAATLLACSDRTVNA